MTSPGKETSSFLDKSAKERKQAVEDKYWEGLEKLLPLSEQLSDNQMKDWLHLTDVKPSVLMVFAANDLPGVRVEMDKVWATVSACPLVSSQKVEDATIELLAESMMDSKDLLMFHFGGHASPNKIVLEDFWSLDKIRLSRLLVPEGHKIQCMFLNGCLSYGQVGLLTAKGVKAIIATNMPVDDQEAVRMASYFYRFFFEKDKSLKVAFETAEATVRGKNAYVTIVNPGEVDEGQAMPSSWTLFVHSNHTEVLNWKLSDFVAAAQQV